MTKVVLIDIEGTIAPISFVKNVLFPYSKKNLPEFLEKNINQSLIQKIIKEIENIEGRKLTLNETIEILTKWIEEDKKITPLKELQGLIWKKGFEKGTLKSPIYNDAYEMISKWKKDGKKLYIYSSGSVKAQKLFFKYTEKGDLLNLFNGHFDTKIGNKKEPSSYLRISQQIRTKPEEITFLSDSPEEITSAAEAGMKVYRIVRPTDAEYISNFPFPQVSSFKEVQL